MKIEIMKTKQDVEERKVWVLQNWFDKLVYVCGWAFIVIFSLGFISGLMGW
jgi:hypothetical protein